MNAMDTALLSDCIAAARGDMPCDLCLVNARVMNLFTGDIVQSAIGIKSGYIVGLDTYEAAETIDLGGRYVIPGLIDSHVHPESAMLEPAQWAREIVPLGTTAVVADPHEIANVLGMKGVEFILERSENLPLHVAVMTPSCVPATHMETAGATLTADDIAALLKHPRVIGVAEMMNFPGVLFRVPEVLQKLAAGQALNRPIDGHAPGVSGRDLNAYLSAGITTDHECFTADEAREKLAAGMMISIREGSAARNLDTLLEVVTPQTADRCMFCTDDRHPLDLKQRGHINSILRQAVAKGLDPVTAVRMATLTPARHYGLARRGAVAPGYVADMVVLDNLTDFNPVMVFAKGVKAAQNGVALFDAPQRTTPWPNAMRLPEIIPDHFAMGYTAADGPVIGVIAGQIVTDALSLPIDTIDGLVRPDPQRDILKLAVIERYSGEARTGLGLVQGFGLQQGAIATSVAHDSHNIIVVGADDESMARAVNKLRNMGGGLAVANGAVKGLPLAVAGLMSALDGDEVRSIMTELVAMTKDMGCVLDEPFMQLAFLALPVIPSLKLTDKGLVDVDAFSLMETTYTRG